MGRKNVLIYNYRLRSDHNTEVRSEREMNLPMLLCPKVNTEYLMAESSVGKALEKFRASGYNALPVLWEDGRYCGSVSSRDFLTYIMENGGAAVTEKGTRLADILQKDGKNPVSIDAPVSELFDRVMEANFVPVVDARDCFVGIVTRKKVLTAMQKYLPEA